MARPEVIGRKSGAHSSGASELPPIRGPPAAYSIRAFCEAHNLSQSMYFKLRSMGLGPREMAVGSRRLISQEAAAEWRKAREAAA